MALSLACLDNANRIIIAFDKFPIVNIDDVMYNTINNAIMINLSGGSIMTDINHLMERALTETANLKDGEIFLLRDLFQGYEWNRISRSNRLLFGVFFLNKVNTGDLGIKAIVKSPSGQQKYQIVRGIE